ncbi:MAG: J domain-containing protein [Acidobacteria bacterium]|nr:J domain-containing protein [Acidobacteriota bacterium]
MSRSYYDLLGVTPGAPLDEIRHAFRREIAKYHPDKVQHLGPEFQEIAAVKAAELTQAYKTLCDGSLRAAYDAALAASGAGAGEPGPEVRDPGSRGRDEKGAAPDAGAARGRAPAEGGDSATRDGAQAAPAAERRPSGGPTSATGRASVGDLLSKAAVARFRQALDAEFGRCEESPVQGFEVACAPPKGRFWSKLPPRILARVVARVDAAAVAETWDLASRMKRDEQREVCVFLMGPVVAPLAELARAIAEEWRKPRASAGRLYLIPVNIRRWTAHIPNDAPAVVKSLVGRLKST